MTLMVWTGRSDSPYQKAISQSNQNIRHLAQMALSANL